MALWPAAVGCVSDTWVNILGPNLVNHFVPACLYLGY